MVSEPIQESLDLDSPGAMLKVARERLQLTEREAADRLNWMPGYVAIVEQDNYSALRRPSFARGYVKAFGRLVELDEERLMRAFDALENDSADASDIDAVKVAEDPMQMQKTGMGVFVGLGLLSLIIAILWWQGNTA